VIKRLHLKALTRMEIKYLLVILKGKKLYYFFILKTIHQPAP